MQPNRPLGYVFLDLALAGIVLSVGALAVEWIGTGTPNWGLLGLSCIVSASYIIGARRVGVSPTGYLKVLRKPPSAD